MSRTRILTVLLAVILAVATLEAATWFNSPVNFDSSGNLKLSAAALGGGQGSTHTLSNSPVNFDSNGNPKVTIAGGTVTPDSICLNAANQDTCITYVSQGILAMTSSNASNAFRIPNGSAAEYGITGGWASNFFTMGSVANGGTARSTRLLSAANLVFQGSAGDQWQITGSNGNFTNLSTGVLSSGTAPGTALANSMFTPGVAFASLGTPTNGTNIFCSDCAPTTPATCPATKASCVCTGSGAGSWAFRANATWYCPF